MRHDFDPEQLDPMHRRRRSVSSGWTRISPVSWEFRLIALVVAVAGALIWSSSQGTRSSSQGPVVLAGHTRVVEAVAFSPDGRTLASCGFDHTVRLWDAARWGDEPSAEPEILFHPSVIFATAFSPDGSRLAAVGDRTLTIWSTKPSYHREEERSGETYRSLAFSPDGRTLALAAEDGTIRLWEVPSARERMVLRGHSGVVRSVAFSPDGKRLASAGHDGRVVIWDATRWTELRVLKQPGPAPARVVAFSPDGRTVGVAEPAYKEKDVLLFDVETGAVRTRLRGHPLGVNALSFSPDGRMLATAGIDHSVKLWDIATAQELASTKEGLWLKSMAFSPDGRWLAYAGGDESVRLLDMTGRRPAAAVPHTIAQGRKST